jgi:hypothetical protein
MRRRSKGDPESSLKIVFDKIIPPGGANAAAIQGTIRAIAPNPRVDPDTGGGMGSADLKEGIVKSAGGQQDRGSVPLLSKQSTGVLGIKNLQLGPDGVLTSTGKGVKLDKGTQVLLTVKMH